MPEAAPALAGVEHQIATGHLLEAEAALESICAQHTGDAHAWFLLGACRHRMGKLPTSLEALARALALLPDHQQAAIAQVAVLCQSGQVEAALARANAWLAFHPGDPQMQFSAGLVRETLGDPAGALARYEQALAIAPAHPGALQNRGIVLMRLGRAEDAVENYRCFVAAYPQVLDAHFNLAEACLAARRYEEVVAAADGALALVPGHPPSLLDRGYALAALDRIEEARVDLRAALEHDDGTLRRRFAAWAESAELADPLDLQTLLQPEDLYLLAGYERVVRCDWSAYEAYANRAVSLIDSAPLGSLCSRSIAFNLLNLPIPAGSHRKLADRVAQGIANNVAHLPRPAAVPRHPRTRLRLGYLSSDFKRHPTSILTQQMYGLHDRGRFEVYGYTLCADDGSEYFQNIKQSCDFFVDMKGWPADAIARRVAADGIDILVDMNGYNRDGRSEVFALRPAPVQVCHVAYPATLGKGLLDYLVADATIVPPAAEPFYAEKIARLPHSYFPTGMRRARVLPTPSREVAGLPETGFVFCAFFRHEKIDPGVFAVWMRILGRVPGSVLWFQQGPGEANLRRHAVAAGIDPGRLLFAPHLAWEAHLARLRLADVYLDTLYWTTHTQGIDGLWSGVPLITLPGEHWASRVGASLLRAVGLEDLIVGKLGEYEALACDLATHPERLREIKQRLARNRETWPLFDTPRLVRNLDAAYLEMWRLHESGAGPRTFDVREPGLPPVPMTG